MNSTELLVELVFIAILVVTAVDFLRHRSRARLDIVLMFGCLIVPQLAQQAVAAMGVANPLFDILAIIAFIVQPLLLLRLVQHFRTVPRVFNRLAVLGLLATIVVMAIFGETNPAVATAAPVLYILALEGYTIWAFLKGARESGGVVRRRLTFAAAGSVFLALTILLSGLSNFVAGTAALVSELTDLSTLLSAVGYYVGFATPRPLRHAWQLAEFYRFLRAPAKPGKDSQAALLQHLSTSATRITGALASAVWLRETADSHFNLRVSDPPDSQAALSQPDSGSLGRAWHERRAVLVQRPAVLDGAPPRVAAVAEAMVVVPLATPNHAWGVLAVYLRRSSLFPDDDASLLALLADQTAETLEREALFNAERTLLERVAQTNTELQAEVTERRRVEAHIQQLNESLTQRAGLLEAANQELEAFSYSVSHDLRAPLRAIDGFSQALLEDYHDQLDETAQGYLGRIRHGAQRMAQLIDDLLRLAGLSRTAITVETVDVSALARTVLGELQTADPERQVEAVVADGLSAQADARLLRVALENLLGNAWKFTSRRENARLEVNAADIGGQTVYGVRDNGAGFDMDSADRLFGAFQRMHSVEQFPGTGIGLAIVQRIIHRHGGRIWAESAPGAGAAFFFVLGAETSV